MPFLAGFRRWRSRRRGRFGTRSAASAGGCDADAGRDDAGGDDDSGRDDDAGRANGRDADDHGHDADGHFVLTGNASSRLGHPQEFQLSKFSR